MKHSRKCVFWEYAKIWLSSSPSNLKVSMVTWVQIPVSTPYMARVCCWFSPLLQEVFLRVLRFSPFPNNQHVKLQFDLESTNSFKRVLQKQKLLSVSWVNKLQFFFISANPKPRTRTVKPDKRGPTLSELGSFPFYSQRWPKIIKALRMRMAWTVLIFETWFLSLQCVFLASCSWNASWSANLDRNTGTLLCSVYWQ